MIRAAFVFSAGVFIALAAPAYAQGSAPESEDGRYSFHRVEEGFLRLDSRTGEVSQCSRRTVGWACQAVPDDRTVLESEIARLQGNNAALKKELLSRGLALPNVLKDDQKSDAPLAKREERELKLPSNADLERVRTFIEKVWQRLVEMIVQLQKDVQQKT